MEIPAAQTILVATDFSVGSDLAFERAIGMAKQMGATLTIVHVVDPTAEFSLGTAYLDVDGGYFASIELALAARAAQARKAGVATITKILEGTVATEITSWARAMGASTIIVGTHGRTALSHILLGSVAEKVVRHAPCPVLTVPFANRAA